MEFNLIKNQLVIIFIEHESKVLLSNYYDIVSFIDGITIDKRIRLLPARRIR